MDHIDSLFAGEVLGHKSDIADGSLRAVDFRVFNNIVGDYYVAPAFLMKVAVSAGRRQRGGGGRGGPARAQRKSPIIIRKPTQ